MGANPKNLMPQSGTLKRLKTTFRRRFESRVKNYQYDVILHVADNYLQSKFCTRLFEIDRNISDFFERINARRYVVIRAKGSRQHTDFPANFYFRSNADIVTDSAEEMNDLATAAEGYAKEHFTGGANAKDWLSIKRVEAEGEIKIQVLLRDFMVYQFEFMTHIFGLSDTFRDECLSHIIADKYKYLPVEDEIIIRIAELARKPHKTWYLPWLEQNLDRLDTARLYAHLDPSQVSREAVDGVIGRVREL